MKLWNKGMEEEAAVPFCFFSSLIGERASVWGPAWWSELQVCPGQMRAPALMNHAAGNRSTAELHIMGAGPLDESFIGRGVTEVQWPQTINQRQFCHYYSREPRHCAAWNSSPSRHICPHPSYQQQVPSALVFFNHLHFSFSWMYDKLRNKCFFSSAWRGLCYHDTSLELPTSDWPLAHCAWEQPLGVHLQ